MTAPMSTAPSLRRIVERVQTAHAQATPLHIVGANTKRCYGRPCAGEPLDLQEHRGIVSHDPSELVVTVKAGTPLTELEAALQVHGQALAFEPPRWGLGGTVGGMVATGLAGPARAKAGGVRDHVLGIELVDGRGRWLRFGGTVMKNVAGYDVSRALVGSLGVLGVITEVSLKVLPRPAAVQTLAFDLSFEAARTRLAGWASQPWPINASCWYRGQLTVRLAGAAAAVAHATSQLGGSVVPAPAARVHWGGLRDLRHAFFSPAGRPQGQRLWRLSVPPGATLPAWDAECLIEWQGAQRWLWTDAPTDWVHRAAAAAGGHAACLAADTLAPHEEAFTRPAAALLQIQQRLKEAFDPLRLLNRSRLFTDL